MCFEKWPLVHFSTPVEKECSLMAHYHVARTAHHRSIKSNAQRGHIIVITHFYHLMRSYAGNNTCNMEGIHV